MEAQDKTLENISINSIVIKKPTILRGQVYDEIVGYPMNKELYELANEKDLIILMTDRVKHKSRDKVYFVLHLTEHKLTEEGISLETIKEFQKIIDKYL